jgi:hypothetical protein
MASGSFTIASRIDVRDIATITTGSSFVVWLDVGDEAAEPKQAIKRNARE